ncbi:MAG TPA: hypothetical protein VEW71_04815 [Allosphingosinicella sp.]|nr:hypothetical protein [Allosphingosinicella sp.]
MTKVFVFAGTLLMSAAAAAQAPSGGQSGSADADDPNRTICRTIASTESRLARTRVCKTRAEWEQARRNARGSTDRPQRNQDSPSE